MEGISASASRDGQSALTLRRATLTEVAARASAHLERAGIPVAVVGGSAVTIHAPEVYASNDIDFAAIRGTTRRDFAAAVAPLGFGASGRDFVHPESRFTLDLVADTPFIDQRPITRFAKVSTRFGQVRVYRFEDAIADRVAAFLHWGDSQSLDVAESAVRARAGEIAWQPIESALKRLDATGPAGVERLSLATTRLRSAYTAPMPRRRSAVNKSRRR